MVVAFVFVQMSEHLCVFSSHYPQSQTILPCWARSENSLMPPPRSWARHWPRCSFRSADVILFSLIPIAVNERFSMCFFNLSCVTQLLCKNPGNRLRNLESFKLQTFFQGTSFDSQILQKKPLDVILELRTHPDWTAKAARGLSLDYFDNFDCDKILNSPTTPSELSLTLANMDLNWATEQIRQYKISIWKNLYLILHYYWFLFFNVY